MFNEALLAAYRSLLEGGGQRSSWLENYLGDDVLAPSSFDDARNLSDVYTAIFSAKFRPSMEELQISLLKEMQEVSFEQSGAILDALACLQQMAATGLWKYHQDVGKPIEAFTRNFDRLDVSGERARLYEYAQEI